MTAFKAYKLLSDASAYEALNGLEAFRFVDAETGAQPLQETLLKIGYTDKFLYLLFQATDSMVVASYVNNNDPLYKDDACEIFISPDGDRAKYYEYEFSPNSLLFSATITNDLKGGFDGTLLERSDALSRAWVTRDGYEIFAAVPFAEIGLDDFTSVLFNCYRADRNEGDLQQLYALNPTHARNFHISDSFVRLEFSEELIRNPQKI